MGDIRDVETADHMLGALSDIQLKKLLPETYDAIHSIKEKSIRADLKKASLMVELDKIEDEIIKRKTYSPPRNSIGNTLQKSENITIDADEVDLEFLKYKSGVFRNVAYKDLVEFTKSFNKGDSVLFKARSKKKTYQNVSFIYSSYIKDRKMLEKKSEMYRDFKFIQTISPTMRLTVEFEDVEKIIATHDAKNHCVKFYVIFKDRDSAWFTTSDTMYADYLNEEATVGYSKGSIEQKQDSMGIAQRRSEIMEEYISKVEQEQKVKAQKKNKNLFKKHMILMLMKFASPELYEKLANKLMNMVELEEDKQDVVQKEGESSSSINGVIGK